MSDITNKQSQNQTRQTQVNEAENNQTRGYQRESNQIPSELTPDKNAHLSSEKFLQAANEASAQARNSWLFFLGVLTYLIITIAGTNPTDLLLNNPVTLPFLGVQIPLFSFFIYAPAVVLSIHLGLLIQHAMLSFKLFRFTETLNDDGWHCTGTDPRRGQLHAYIVTQLIAGPERGPLIGFYIRLMVWLTIVAMPVLTLIYFQIAFLPYHDVTATYWHRIAVLLDCLLLFSLWPYIRPATKREARKRKSRRSPNAWKWRLTILGAGVGSTATVALLLFSWFVATIPDSCFYEDKKNGTRVLCLDGMMASFTPWTVKIQSGNTEREVFWLTAKLFEGEVDPVTGRPSSWFSRNIVLTDADLVPEKDFSKDEVSLSLRGRDLRYAILDRSDLHRVDFTGVDLRGASLKETRLEQAKFCLPLRVFPRTCSEFSGADLKEANLQGVDFWGAKLDGAQLAFVRLEGADFRNAQLEGANLSFAELNGADLSLANLQGAKLSYAKMQGANLSEAELQAANFNSANLQGANFSKAQMEGINLSAANLQAVDLAEARLHGADLSNAKLEGADLRKADLRGSNLEAASLIGSDLRFAQLWKATYPGSRSALDMANLGGASFVALTKDEQEDLKGIINGFEEEGLRTYLSEKFTNAGLLKPKKNIAWNTREEWLASYDRYKRFDLTEQLDKFNEFWTDLACNNIQIAEAISGRLNKNGYFSDTKFFSRQLTSRSCNISINLKKDTKIALCQTAQWTVNEREETVCK